jgi:hypothetical protein
VTFTDYFDRSAGENVPPVTGYAIRVIENLLGQENSKNFNHKWALTPFMTAGESQFSKVSKHVLASNDSISTFEQVVKTLIVRKIPFFGSISGSLNINSQTNASNDNYFMSFNTTNLVTPFEMGTPSSLTGALTPEEIWDLRSFDISKLSPSILSTQGLQLQSFDVGGQFDQIPVSYV